MPANARDKSSKEVFKCIEDLKHHHGDTICFWKIVLEYHDMQRFQDFKSSIILFAFLEKQKQ